MGNDRNNNNNNNNNVTVSNNSTNNNGTLLDTMLSSSISGMIARIPLHPVDTAKAKMQVATSTTHNAGTTTRLYKSVIDCLYNTYKQEGIRGLYSGFGITFFGSAPALCLYLTSYEMFKNILSVTPIIQQTPTFIQHFSSGLLAECISCILWVPIDVVKERLQTQSNLQYNARLKNIHINTYNGNINAIKQILQQEGIYGIYKGYGATVASFGPFSAIYLSGV